MKKLIRFMSLFLLALILFVIPVQAMGDGVQRASDYFMGTSTYLYKTSDTEFDVCFDVIGLDIMSEIGAKTIKVQRSLDGETWTTVETHTREDYPEMIAKNTVSHNDSFSFTATKGYYYREYVEYYAKNGSGSATMFAYSSKLKM